MSVMRAKMKINHIDKPYEGQEILYFNPVSRSDSYPADGSDENNTYAKFSPSGMLSLTVCNPALLGNLNTSTLEEIWNGELATKLREKFLTYDYEGCGSHCPVVMSRLNRGVK